MLDSNVLTFLDQAGSVRSAMNQVLSNVQQSIAAIDRVISIKTAWQAEVDAERLAADNVTKLAAIEAELADLKTALVAYRDANQGA